MSSRVRKTVFFAAAALGWAGPAPANGFDDCVLDKMAVLASDAAAKGFSSAKLSRG
jgi:hypothetical protein